MLGQFNIINLWHLTVILYKICACIKKDESKQLAVIINDYFL